MSLSPTHTRSRPLPSRQYSVLFDLRFLTIIYWKNGTDQIENERSTYLGGIRLTNSNLNSTHSSSSKQYSKIIWKKLCAPSMDRLTCFGGLSKSSKTPWAKLQMVEVDSGLLDSRLRTIAIQSKSNKGTSSNQVGSLTHFFCNLGITWQWPALSSLREALFWARIRRHKLSINHMFSKLTLASIPAVARD